MPHTHSVRVSYADTDQGGVVYHARYLEYFEAGRTEMMRELGCPYAELEEQGIIMPVVEARMRYLAPARYDDLLLVESEVVSVRKVRLCIDTSVRRAATGELLAEGSLWLACTRAGRPCRVPERLLDAL